MPAAKRRKTATRVPAQKPNDKSSITGFAKVGKRGAGRAADSREENTVLGKEKKSVKSSHREGPAVSGQDVENGANAREEGDQLEQETSTTALVPTSGEGIQEAERPSNDVEVTISSQNPSRPGNVFATPKKPRGRPSKKSQTNKDGVATPKGQATPSSSSPTSSILTPTPTRGATAILNSLHLAPSSSPSPRKRRIEELEVSNQDPLPAAAGKANPLPKSDSISADLPVQLLDLIGLTSSFLTALSLYFAHHGSATPADLREVLPSVARVWGRRSVRVEDVQRIIGVLRLDEKEAKENTLRLTDFGHGRVCVELENCERKSGHLARPIDEEKLCKVFEKQLEKIWREWLARDGGKEIYIDAEKWDAIVKTIPLAQLEPCTSLGTSSKILSKGQSRLEDFRIGVKQRKEREDRLKDISKGKVSGKSLQDRKQELMKRMQAKTLKQTTINPTETRKKMEQIAAAHKVLEVAAVIRILSSNSPQQRISDPPDSTSPARTLSRVRESLPLPTLLQHVQNSNRFPASKDEAARCVRLLAEIAPAWVGIFKVGSVEAVVISGENKVHDLELKERLKHLV